MMRSTERLSNNFLLSEHRILQLRTTKGEKLEAEVNWSSNDKIKDCQVVRLRMDGKEYDIKRDDLTTLLMVFGDESTMKKLMPLKTNTIRKVERLLTFKWKASRDYQKGEEIEVTAPWIDQVVTEDELMSGNFKKRKPVNYGQ
jgi:hypothetical protein